MQPTLAAPDKNITPIARIAPNHIGALSSSLPAPVRKGALQYSFFSTTGVCKSKPNVLGIAGMSLQKQSGKKNCIFHPVRIFDHLWEISVLLQTKFVHLCKYYGMNFLIFFQNSD